VDLLFPVPLAQPSQAFDGVPSGCKSPHFERLWEIHLHPSEGQTSSPASWPDRASKPGKGLRGENSHVQKEVLSPTGFLFLKYMASGWFHLPLHIVRLTPKSSANIVGNPVLSLKHPKFLVHHTSPCCIRLS
jgi:hypothetical protein